MPLFRQQASDGDPPEWSPPSYATAIGNEEEWKPPEYATAIGEEKKSKGIWDRISEPLTDAPTRFAESVSKYINPERTIKGIKGIGSAYVEGLGHAVSGLTSPVNLAFAALSGGTSAAAKAGLPEIAAALRTGSRILSAPVAVEGASNIYKGVRDRDFPETLAGGLETGLGVLGMRKSHASAKVSEELPIRQSREIPYRLEGEVLTPKEVASTRRDNLQDYMKKNPDAKIADIEKFMKDVKSTVPKSKELPIRESTKLSPVDPREQTVQTEETKTTPTKSIEDQKYDLARNKFNMGRDLPTEEKPKFVNPFEKPKVTEEAWKPPDYATSIDEPQAARTESGKLAIGADIKSLGKVLGTSLYKGDIVPIATKELLQNSIDAVRHLGTEGKIDVILDQKNNIIHVSDNGKGLTRQELESVFTDLGASGKRDDISASGGFGLAKAAPLLGGEKVEVSSITRDARGISHEYSFEGTPNELLEGVDIKHKVMPSETNTGTTVKVHIPKDSSFYDARRFVENLSKHSPNIQSKIRLGVNYSIKYNPEDILSSLPKEEKTSIATLDNSSAQVELSESRDSSRKARSYFNLNLSNNGMYQGTKIMYLPQEVPNIPSSITVDIRSKVPEGHADYPFTANREELRGSVEEQVQKYINENVIKPGIGKRLDELKRLYNSMQEVTVGKGQFPNMFGHKIAIYDPKGQITPAEMQSITSNSAFHTLVGNIAGTLKEALKIMDKPAWTDRLEKIGIIFDDSLHGIHIPNPGSGKSAILVNPFIAISKMSPDEASANILHTILHELSHVEPDIAGHNEAFAVQLGEVYGKFGARRSIEAQDQILKSIANPNTGIYHPEIQEILSTYKASRGREATTEDLLSGTGVKSRLKGGGEEDIPKSDKSDGEGTSAAVNKLFNSLIEAKGANVEQQVINKAETAKRFAAFSDVKQGGIAGAAERLGKLKGEFEKAVPGEILGLSPIETNSMFTAIDTARIDNFERARGYTALFKLLNGEEIPKKNELEILDKVFGKHFSKVSGPGASGKFDIQEGTPTNFIEAGEVARKRAKPDDFLTKLANLSTKTTRTVLGFHIPGTAISFHGFNEAIRNTIFGPDFNPFKAAGRFGEASYYLARPNKAQEFLDANLTDLSKAIEEGGLKATTGDIGISSLFKGSNFITKGINALTSPKPLFGRVIPALKLKSYNGLLEQYEKSGIEHNKAAKLAGYATNNIFGGLNLHELERSPTTQKLFRAAALAPDWLESNVRLGKGMFNSIKNPMSPENRVYQVGMANFLGSYIVLNVINAINNNGRFSFQNEVGHEFDIAFGKDSAGRVRYFSPYGTAMDMFRIPLEIAHAAVEGNMGKAFSDLRSRASEPVQFLTDLMTNTDYAGRSLYDKTKFGKSIPRLEQGENIVGDAAGHFLPIGIESGINLAQGKVSPEQFAAQVLQAPMKYKLPEKPKNSFRKMKLR